MKRLIGGQPLYTKNEFSFSNASVLCVGTSGKAITYQIRSVHGNIGVLKDPEVEQHFNLQPINEGAVEPSVKFTTDGFSLTVDENHAENIKAIVPTHLYLFEVKDSLGTFKVSRNEWSRFSDLLCL